MPHLGPHLFFRHRKTIDGMNAFYLNSMLRTLVLAIVGIFTPVYLFTEGQALFGSFNAGLYLVALFYLVVRTVTLVIAIPVSKIIERIGFRKSIFISVILLSLNLLSLYLSHDQLYFVFLAAVLSGLNIPFYWISRMSAIAIDSKTDDIGRQVGLMTLLEKVSYILGPFAGGIIIERWGFQTMYLTAFVLLLFSVVPVFMMPHHVHRNGVSLKGFFLWVKDRKFFHQAISTVSRAYDDYGNGVLWPLVVSFLSSGAVVVGSLFSAVSVMSLIVRYVSGVIFDKLHDKGGNEDEVFFGVSAIMNSALWVVRIFLTTISQVLVVDLTLGSFGTAYRNMADSYLYLGGKRMSEIAYNTYREMMYSIATISFTILMGVGIYFGVWKELLMICISFWVVMSMVLSRESNMAH